MKKTIIKKLKTIKRELKDHFEINQKIDELINDISKIELNESQDCLSSNEQFPLPIEVVETQNSYAIFTDGACRGNPGPGAWGAMAQNSFGEILYTSNGHDHRSTNNIMELSAAIEGLKNLKSFFEENDIDISNNVFLYSDSKYVVDGITKWVKGWKSRNWKKADKKPPENLELWKELDKVSYEFPNLKFLWVKGHDGHPQNEFVDQLANQALDEAGF